MSNSATGGNDQLRGGAGEDYLWGDSAQGFADMGSSVRGGADLLEGGAGDDFLVGDFNVAGQYDQVTGTVICGNDRLAGNAGDDVLWGDVNRVEGTAGVARGQDVFVFENGCGRDTLRDFDDGPSASDPQDRIDLTGYSGIGGFNNLSISGTITDVVNGVSISGNIIDLDLDRSRA